TNINNMEGCDIVESSHLNMAGKLLEVNPKALEKSLTQRSFQTNQEKVTKPLTSEQALDGRDAFVKAIYGRLFVWVVDKINAAVFKLLPEDTEDVHQCIGLLDIFGFENFVKNSFEQLCINFANEQLQQFFVRRVFKLEQAEYSREGIAWTHIDYHDNQHTLDVLASKPLNVLSLIDEESSFPKGTDATMMQKIHAEHGTGKVYLPPKNDYERQFGISHFAGVVFYDSQGFLEKNRDAFSSDVIELVETSDNQLLKEAFKSELSAGPKNSSTNPRLTIKTQKNFIRQGIEGKKRSLIGQFRQSLDALMKTLAACQPYFIRCIKPNDLKQPKFFDRELCMRQLRYSGMMETITIRKMGFPIRYTFGEFLERYRVLLHTSTCDPNTESKEACCESICQAVLAVKGQWRRGKTKIFLKDFHDTMLELERMKKLNEKALLIQRVLRGYKNRRQFLKKKAAALVIQKHWRGHQGRKIYKVVQVGLTRLQARVRSRQIQQRYQKKREAALLLQAQVRGLLARKEWRRKRDAVVLLQAHTRGLLARKAAKKRGMFVSAKERRDEELAISERQRRLEEALYKQRETDALRIHSDPASAQEMVDDIFKFLPPEGSPDGTPPGGQAPMGFKDLEPQRMFPETIDLDEVPMEDQGLPEEDNEDLDEYSFSKFASMYFQGAATPTYVRHRLAQPLIHHEDEGDVQASLMVWWIILRFMADLPEPKQRVNPLGPPGGLGGQGSRAAHAIPQDLASRNDRRLSHMVGLDQRVLRGKQDRKPSSVPEQPPARKGSVFTDMLSRNRKASAVPSEVVTGGKVGEGVPRVRKGSMFTDLMSRNKKATSALPENGIPESPTGSRKTLGTVEESEHDADPSGDMMPVEMLTLERPMTLLEKLQVIVGYAIVRRDLRDEIYCQICKQLEGNSNRNSYLRGWILLSLCLGIFPPSERFIKYLQSFLRSGPGGYGPYCAERLRRTVQNGVRGEPPSWLELQASRGPPGATKTKTHMTVSLTLMDGRTISLPVDSASTSGEICQKLSQKVQLKDSFGFSMYVALYEKVWALGSGREHVMDSISQCEQEVRRKGGQEQHAPWRLYYRKEVFTPWHDCRDDPVSTDLIYKQIIRGLKFGEYQSKKEEDYVELTAKHLYIQHGSDGGVDTVKAAVQDCISGSLLEAKPEAKWVQMVSTAHAQRTMKAEVVEYARQNWPMFFSRFFEVVKVSGPALSKSHFIVAINWTGITFLDDRERRLVELSYPEVTGVNTVREGKSSVVCLLTLRGDFSLSGAMTEDLAALVLMFLGGLRERSHYAVALRDANSPDDATLLSFKKGELLVLVKDQEFSVERGWVKAKSDRTGKSGAVPSEAILVLPTLSKPTNEVMRLLSLSPDQRKSVIQATQDTTEKIPLSTLKEFSIEQPTQDVSRLVMSKNVAPERLWLHSREPLRQALLRRLYMGDYPTKQSQSALELTDQIFEPATQNEALRDEIYCQVMKQMTSNNNRFSLEQGWQLLWLCCGLFPPGPQLLKHTQRFLETRRREPLAADCLKRLQNSCRTEPRKLPPHQVEVDAIQQNNTQIYHKIHFPNDTEEVIEVTTSTRVRNLVQSITKKLSLNSAEGFSVFVKTPDTVLSLNEADYFFDSLRQITDWTKRAKRVNDGNSLSELPKYLRGYHAVSREEMVQLGALLFRIQTGGDPQQLAALPKLLKDLLPADQIKTFSENEWKKSITAAYNKQAKMSVEEAMVDFLKATSRWPTFGCAFFDVKQTSDRNLPDMVRISIGRTGVTILHPKTKEVLAMHAFNRIANWCSGSTYFHMTLGSLVQGSKFLCETSLGYKMDDLITSYVNMYLSVQRAGQRHQRFNV
ncbi:hypothetical protein NHX12_034070, partial [Muraenolepis orangiensis]